MTYLEQYRARMYSDGPTEKDRIENRLARDYQLLLRKSPNRVQIFYNNDEGIEQSEKCILASGNSRVGTQTERKVLQYLMTARTLRLDEGELFYTYDLDMDEKLWWLILHREIHPYYGYFKYKIIELDYKLKYVDDAGNVKEIPVYVNGTGEFDIKEYFKFTQESVGEIPNRALNLILKANEDFGTRELRFIIGDEAWRYVDTDKISIPGVFYTTLFRDPVDPAYDDLTDKIADVNKVNSVTWITNYGDSSTLTLGTNSEPISFTLLREGKQTQSSIQFSDFDPQVIDYDGNIIKVVGEGETPLIVTDKVTNYKQTFQITVEGVKSDFFYVNGEPTIGTLQHAKYTINTDHEYEVVYDKTRVKIERANGGIIITALEKIGKTQVTFEDNGQTLAVLPIEVTSLWV